MKTTVRVAIAQLDPVIGDFEANARKLDAAARQSGADLLLAPELFLPGYFPCDLIDRPGFFERQNVWLDWLIEQSREWPCAALFGAIERNPGVGRPWRNSAFFIERGETLGVARKMLLPTYDVFDERRHFEPGEEPLALDWRGFRIGVLICEDGWNHAGFDYAADPVSLLAQKGAKSIFLLNASPASTGKAAHRVKLFAPASVELGVAQVYANQVGGQDDVIFDGASFAVGSDGAAFGMKPFEEAVGLVDVDLSTGLVSPARGLAPASEAFAQSFEDFAIDALVHGLRSYTQKCGFQKVVVGSSGGVDSALTIALAAMALGPQNVDAIAMPSAFSSPESVSDSRALCDRLGVPMRICPIAESVNAQLGALGAMFGEEPKRVTLENLQARLRGQILMAFSNHFGDLLLSTGNKSELSVGYATLYGDMNGGLNVIGDLYKMEVYAVSRRLNERFGFEAIPTEILDKAPSAELFPGQKDSDSLPPYPVLDACLKLLVESDVLDDAQKEEARALLARAGFDGAQAARILKMLDRAEFKRKQAPPILRLRPRAFGFGRRVPVACKPEADLAAFGFLSPEA
jgi:NAD+ synthetase